MFGRTVPGAGGTGDSGMGGRTPWSARVPPDPLSPWNQNPARCEQADGGVGRGPGGPPHQGCFQDVRVTSMSESEARLAARREFGSIEITKETAAICAVSTSLTTSCRIWHSPSAS